MGRPKVNVNIGGAASDNKHAGTTDGRPVNGILTGFQYFDTDLGKPVWWNGEGWVDAMGDDPDVTGTKLLNEQTSEE